MSRAATRRATANGRQKGGGGSCGFRRKGMIGIHVSDNQAGYPSGRPPGDPSEWVTGVSPTPGAGSHASAGVPERIGRYVIQRKLGEGGMGVVYAAYDERLQRTVALKMLSALLDESAGRERLWREARLAASVNHPNVCQIFEVEEDEGRVCMAMELLEGEPLNERLRRGALHLPEALAVGLQVLAALSALHARGVVHRDLKPSNVFLTGHGVKLLDFGLARPPLAGAEHEDDLGRSFAVAGTPRYMSPEQIGGEAVDPRTDVFAAGAVLFEMLAGRPAFNGRTVAEVLHATRHEQPPALVGSPAIAALDRVIRRAMAKQPADRFASAEAMARELRAVGAVEGNDAPLLAHTLTRLVVLPFRVLRADPETDFLASSLPDAIATSLSSNTTVVVRSAAVAARFGAGPPDLKALAVEADVDRVVMGTLLRSGDRVRATAQLVEAPSGTLLASHTAQSRTDDLFELQDDIARRVSGALALPLAGAPPSPLDRPRAPQAYELYLRANDLARSYHGLTGARELYTRALELDSLFAPAWAHLGRAHWVIGKYIEPSADSEARAESALRRALALNPRLSVAHKLYAHLEADTGRAHAALVRLLHEADRHGNDPELFAGLVHACRYCGLFDESLAAHAEARRLDPNVPTSVDQTLMMRGDLDRLLATVPPPLIAGGDDGIRVIGLGMAARREEARTLLSSMRQRSRIPLFDAWTDYLAAWIDRRRVDLSMLDPQLRALTVNDDPEAIFQEGWMQCDLGEHERGLPYLRRAVSKGYFPVRTLAERPQFDPLRTDPRFLALMEEAAAGRQRALEAFREAGGVRLLGQ